MPDKHNDPISNKDQIAQNPDHKIDQDFEGYPNGPASDKSIKPKNKEDEKTADIDNKDGEKRFIHPDERKGLDEQESDGSANTFEGKS